jgi:hypothetical protein
MAASTMLRLSQHCKTDHRFARPLAFAIFGPTESLTSNDRQADCLSRCAGAYEQGTGFTHNEKHMAQQKFTRFELRSDASDTPAT